MRRLLTTDRALELAIGLICACLPTINLLIQKKLDIREFLPNRPRTGHSRVRKRGRALLYWSFGTARTANTLSSRGRSLKPGGEILTYPSTLSRTHSDDIWGYDPRATSIDGHREGWLQHTKETRRLDDLEAFPKQTKAIKEVQKSWDDAWDSRQNPSSGTIVENAPTGTC